MNYCIVIPVYNSPYIKEVVEELIPFGYPIIVVDDGCDERVNLEPLDVTLVHHVVNIGKGEAILSGAKKAKELGYDCFITMDADKQHIASQIKKLLDVYEEGSIVIGNRDFSGDNVPDSSKFGRKFSNFWVALESWTKLGDTQSGFRMYPITILDLPLKNKRFDFEIEILVFHRYRGGKIIDIEVECYYPPKEERVSHFDKLHDNIRLTIVHTKLMCQRYLLLRGWLWR